MRIFDLRFRYGTANMVQVSQIQSQVDAAESSYPTTWFKRLVSRKTTSISCLVEIQEPFREASQLTN